MVNHSAGDGGDFLAVEGARLAYAVRGEGPPLVLLHAGIADMRMWHAQVPALASAFRVICYDARGFGRTTMPDGSFARHSDLHGVLGALGVGRATLLAASMGGVTALDFALAYPEMVAGLVLVAPSIGGRRPAPEVLRFWEAEEAALEAGDLDGAVELNLRMWVDGPRRIPEQVDPAVRALVGAMQRRAFDLENPAAKELPPARAAAERLAEIRAPMLVLVGAEDIPDKFAVADELVASVAGARQHILPGGAHMVNMEQPAAFNATVLAFLGPS